MVNKGELSGMYWEGGTSYYDLSKNAVPPDSPPTSCEVVLNEKSGGLELAWSCESSRGIEEFIRWSRIKRGYEDLKLWGEIFEAV